MKAFDLKSNTYIASSKEINNKIPKFKMVLLLEYHDIKAFLHKVTFQIGMETLLWLKS